MSELKKGDLAVVVGLTPCGHGKLLIGRILEVALVGFISDTFCSRCMRYWADHTMVECTNGGYYLLSTVRKIEPLSEKEEEHDYIGSVA